MATSYASDPAYAAWLASLGFMEQTHKQTARDSVARIEQGADFNREGVLIDRDRSLEGIGGGFENRGLTRSGEHERRRAESLRDSNRRLGGLELQTANQVGDASARLARELADLEMRDAAARQNAAARAGTRAGAGL